MAEIILVAIVVVLCLGLAYLLYTRGSQLRLALDLVSEARRQLDQVRTDRHALVPEYLRMATAHSEQDEHHQKAVQDALRRAKTVKDASEIGQAEERLTHAIDALAIGLIEVDRHRQSLGAAIDLHAQMRIIEGRIVSGIRYYNLAVAKYTAQRRQPTALVLRTAFPALEPMEYQDVEVEPVVEFRS